MIEKKSMPQMLTLSGLVLVVLILGAMIPGLIQADDYINLTVDPSSQVVARGNNASLVLTVENTNSVTLTNVTVNHGNDCDSLSGPSGDSGTTGVLDIGETWTYNCTVGAVNASFTFAAQVNATRGASGPGVSDYETATVTVADFNFDKTTNTPIVLVDSNVVFTLTVDNTGDVSLLPVLGGTSDPLCDDPNFLSNPSGDDGDFILDTNEIWTVNCTVSNVTVDFTNEATVTFAATGVQIQKSAQVTVRVIDPGIQIAKEPDTQVINSGQTATFTITVRNTGDDPLTNIVVTDSQASDCNNNYSQLNAQQSRRYSCTVDDVQEGFINSATVSGTPLVGPYVTDADAAEILITEEVGSCPADMVAYWKLDETGGAPYDDSYSGHDGVCAGTCPTGFTNGRVSNAQMFDGIGAGINIPAIPGDDSFNWQANDDFSIEVWVKGVPGQTCTGSNNEVVIGRDDSNSNLHWWLGCLKTTGKTRFGLADTAGDYVPLEGPVINDGDWHHLVGIRDGIHDLNRLYVDGVEVDSVTKIYAAGFDSPSASLNIGWLNLGSGFHFKGQLDEVAVYNRVLSPSEVEGHFNNGILRSGLCGAPNIISTPVTFAKPEEPYTYTVEAVGDPNPTYALTMTPTGMIINSTTGEITWTPTSEQVGTHNVQVEARNSAGKDFQDFVIGVSSSAGNGRVYLPLIMR